MIMKVTTAKEEQPTRSTTCFMYISKDVSCTFLSLRTLRAFG